MKGNKLSQLINHRLRVTLLDGRVIIGQLLAHDKHFNLVMVECEEFRLPRKSLKNTATASIDPATNSLRRTLGMIVLRGEEVVSVTLESGAPPRGGNQARVPASVLTATSTTSTGGSAIPAPGTGLTGPGVRL